MAARDRTLYVLRYLWEFSDDDHQVTTADILKYLAAHGFSIDRHTLALDLERLQEFGFDVICTKGSPNRYFIGSRSFELPELRLLIDAVNASPVLPAQKSRALAEKLCSLTSTYQASALTAAPDLTHRKGSGRALLYTVDLLHRAISEGKRVRFQYVDFTLNREKSYRHGGYRYRFSPYTLLWQNGCYYAVGFSERRQKIAVFRVDRMENLEELEQAIVPRPENFDPSVYLDEAFSMFAGEPEQIRLRCTPDMMRVILDRFGKAAAIEPCSGGFLAEVRVCVSPLFFGWLFGLEGKVQIEAPQAVADRYHTAIRAALEQF